MYIIKHLITGAAFALALFIFFPSIGMLNASIILLATVLIDADHYLSYSLKKKNLNLKKAYFWFRERRFFKEGIKPHFVFHSVEVLIPLAVLSFTLFPVLKFVLLGFFFHISFDLYKELTTRKFHFLKYSLVVYALTDFDALIKKSLYFTTP